MRGVDHHHFAVTGGLQKLTGGFDGLCVVVGFLAAAQNDVAVFIAGCGDNGGDAALGNGKEGVRVFGRADGVHGDLHGTVGGVFKAHGAGKAACELPVHLAFRGARADGAPAHKVRNVLRRDHVEVLNPRGRSHVVDVKNELTGNSQAVVDAAGAVHVGVVDEPLPAHRRARLFKVHTHDDLKFPLQLTAHFREFLGVLARGLGVMNGAGSHHNNQSVVVTVQDVVRGKTRAVHGVGSDFFAGKFPDEV